MTAKGNACKRRTCLDKALPEQGIFPNSVSCFTSSFYYMFPIFEKKMGLRKAKPAKGMSLSKAEPAEGM